MKNVQLFEEFVNNLSSNPLTEADAAAASAEVYPNVPPFEVNIVEAGGKTKKQIITNPAYFLAVDKDSPDYKPLGVLEADLPKEYTAYKDWKDRSTKTMEARVEYDTDYIVDYIDEGGDDEAKEKIVYRIIFGDDAYYKKYLPGKSASNLPNGPQPALKNRVFLSQVKAGYRKWIPLVELYRAAYCKDEAMETLAKMKEVNKEFYDALVDCYKYWMDNVNKAGIKNTSALAGKPIPKKPTA